MSTPANAPYKMKQRAQEAEIAKCAAGSQLFFSTGGRVNRSAKAIRDGKRFKSGRRQTTAYA